MTRLMGILNTTPDSFFDGGRSFSLEKAITRGINLAEEGADIIDVGGESTRPFAHTVPVEEEINRVVPVIEALKEMVAIPISIDTRKPAVAQAALEAGAAFLNDVTGFQDPEMRALAATYSVPICVMHMQGEPLTMQVAPRYPEGILAHLKHFFEERVNTLLNAGIKKEQIYLDPGIGFGKTIRDNWEILYNIPKLKELGFPLLVGVSRKSLMGKLLNRKPEELLFETLGTNALLAKEGVDILRVHDVKENKKIVHLFNEVQCLIG